MFTLTDIRFNKAKELLDIYNERFLRTHTLNATRLEKELRDLWDTGYREIKDIAIQLSKRPEYKLMAIRFMESGHAVVSEFKTPLAKFYGMKNDDYDRPERRQKQQEFWDRAFGEPVEVEAE